MQGGKRLSGGFGSGLFLIRIAYRQAFSQFSQITQ